MMDLFSLLMERFVLFCLADLDFFDSTWVYTSLYFHTYSGVRYAAPLALVAVVGGVGGCVFMADNVLKILMCLEVALAGLGFGFALAAVILLDPLGQMMALVLLTVAAADAAVGLAVLVSARRACGTVEIKQLTKLRG